MQVYSERSLRRWEAWGLPNLAGQNKGLPSCECIFSMQKVWFVLFFSEGSWCRIRGGWTPNELGSGWMGVAASSHGRGSDVSPTNRPRLDTEPRQFCTCLGLLLRGIHHTLIHCLGGATTWFSRKRLGRVLLKEGLSTKIAQPIAVTKDWPTVNKETSNNQWRCGH